MSSQRAHRVGETIRKEVSSLLLRGLKDPRIGFVTITAVDVTPDLSQAKIFYSLIGSAEERRATAAGLKSSSPYIRQQLGRVLRLRFIPEIQFEYDTSVEYGQHIEKLLSEVRPEETDED